jgi:hypothetical protein
LDLKDLTDGDDDISFDEDDGDEEDSSRGDVVVTLNEVWESGSTLTPAQAIAIKDWRDDDASIMNTTTNVTSEDIVQITVEHTDGTGNNLHFDKVVSELGLVAEIVATSDLAATDPINFYEQNDDGDVALTFSSASFTADMDYDSDDDAYAAKGAGITNWQEVSDDEDVGYVKSDLATKVNVDSDAHTFEIEYFGAEVYAKVAIASADAEVTSTDAGVMTVKDSEVATVASKNLVVVGGSAINSLAAELLGGAYSEAAFTSATGVGAGEFLIESFTRSGKTALLVAGYNAADTEKAATYLLNNDVTTTVGTKIKGTSATEATVVTEM